MKKIFSLVLLSALFACEEKDLTVDNPAPSDKNILLATSFIYGDEGLNPDSVLTNDLGYRFFITEVQLVASHFFFVEGEDTVVERTEPFVVSMKQTDELILNMPPGGYSGYYGLKFGLDSLESATITPSKLDEDSDLKNADVFRNDKLGIDHVIIKGRLINPTDPMDSTGTINLNYRLGTYYTTKVKTSQNLNFSLMRDSQVKFIMQVDVEPLLNSFDMFKTPQIVTDPTIPVDFNTALDMADSLKIGLF